MEKIRVRVGIMGRYFNLLSDKDEEYVNNIADMVDSKMHELKKENPELTYDAASMLTALNFCGELYALQNGIKEPEEEKEDEDVIRTQLVEYSRELSKATGTIKRLEKELERIQRESAEKEERIKREYAAKEKEIMDLFDSM